MHSTKQLLLLGRLRRKLSTLTGAQQKDATDNSSTASAAPAPSSSFSFLKREIERNDYNDRSNDDADYASSSASASPPSYHPAPPPPLPSLSALIDHINGSLTDATHTLMRLEESAALPRLEQQRREEEGGGGGKGASFSSSLPHFSSPPIAQQNRIVLPEIASLRMIRNRLAQSRRRKIQIHSSERRVKGLAWKGRHSHHHHQPHRTIGVRGGGAGAVVDATVASGGGGGGGDSSDVFNAPTGFEGDFSEIRLSSNSVMDNTPSSLANGNPAAVGGDKEDASSRSNSCPHFSPYSATNKPFFTVRSSVGGGGGGGAAAVSTPLSAGKVAMMEASVAREYGEVGDLADRIVPSVFTVGLERTVYHQHKPPQQDGEAKAAAVADKTAAHSSSPSSSSSSSPSSSQFDSSKLIEVKTSVEGIESRLVAQRVFHFFSRDGGSGGAGGEGEGEEVEDASYHQQQHDVATASQQRSLAAMNPFAPQTVHIAGVVGAGDLRGRMLMMRRRIRKANAMAAVDDGAAAGGSARIKGNRRQSPNVNRELQEKAAAAADKEGEAEEEQEKGVKQTEKQRPQFVAPIRPLVVSTSVQFGHYEDPASMLFSSDHHRRHHQGSASSSSSSSPPSPPPMPLLHISHTTTMDVSPWIADHVSASHAIRALSHRYHQQRGADANKDDDHDAGATTASSSSPSSTVPPHPQPQHQSLVPPPHFSLAYDCSNIHSYVSEKVVPTVMYLARETQTNQHKRTTTSKLNGGESERGDKSSSDGDEEHQTSAPSSSPSHPSSAPLPPLLISPAAVEYVAAALRACYAEVLRTSLLDSTQLEYGRNSQHVSSAEGKGATGEDEAIMEDNAGGAADSRESPQARARALKGSNGKTHQRSVLSSPIFAQRSRVKAELLKNDPTPMAMPMTSEEEGMMGEGSSSAASQQQFLLQQAEETDAQRLMVEDKSVADMAKFYKSRVAAIGVASISLSATDAKTNRLKSDGNTTQNGGSGGNNILRFSTERVPLFEAYRTFHRVSTERDFIIAVTARTWLWRETIRRILAIELNAESLYHYNNKNSIMAMFLEGDEYYRIHAAQRLFAAAALVCEAQNSSASAGSVHQLAAQIIELVVSSSSSLSSSSPSSVKGPTATANNNNKDAAVASLIQNLAEARTITPQIAASVFNTIATLSSSSPTAAPSQEKDDKDNKKSGDKRKRSLWDASSPSPSSSSFIIANPLPSFSTSLTDLVTSAPFYNGAIASFKGQLPYANYYDCCGGEKSGEKKKRLDDSEENKEGTGSASESPSLPLPTAPLAPPPHLPPMPWDHDSAVMPSQRFRPYPNIFAARAHAMEAARVIAEETAEAEWRQMMARRRQKQLKEQRDSDRRRGRAKLLNPSNSSSLKGRREQQRRAEQQFAAAAAAAGIDLGDTTSSSFKDTESTAFGDDYKQNISAATKSSSSAFTSALSSLFSSKSLGDGGGVDGPEAVLTDDVVEALRTLEALDQLNSLGLVATDDSDAAAAAAAILKHDTYRDDLADNDGMGSTRRRSSYDAAHDESLNIPPFVNPYADSSSSSPPSSTSGASSSALSASTITASEAFRFANNVDANATYHTMMKEMPKFIAAVKVDSLQKRMLKRAMKERGIPSALSTQKRLEEKKDSPSDAAAESVDGSNPANSVAAEDNDVARQKEMLLREIQERTATDPSLLDTALMNLASAPQINKAISHLVSIEEKRRRQLIKDRIAAVRAVAESQKEAAKKAAEQQSAEPTPPASTSTPPSSFDIDYEESDKSTSYFAFIRKRKELQAEKRHQAAAADNGDAPSTSTSLPVEGTSSILSEFRQRLSSSGNVSREGEGMTSSSKGFAAKHKDELGRPCDATATTTAALPSSPASSPRPESYYSHTTSEAAMAAFGQASHAPTNPSNRAPASSMPSSHQLVDFDRVFQNASKRLGGGAGVGGMRSGRNGPEKQ